MPNNNKRHHYFLARIALHKFIHPSVRPSVHPSHFFNGKLHHLHYSITVL